MQVRGSTLMAVLVSLLFLAACRPSAPVDGAAPPGAVAAPSPDISGIWEPALDFGPEGAQDRAAWLTRPKPELTPEYVAKHRELQEIYATAESGAVKKFNARQYAIIRRMVGECVPYGMPQMMASDGDGASETLDISQSKDAILMIGEGGLGPHIRHIYLDRGQLPIEEVEPTYMGRSVAKWEGDVLVVNTVGVKKELEGQDLVPHSDQMVITERIHLENELLNVEITINDPLALLKPWTYLAKFKRAAKDYEPSEGYCENSNAYRFGEDGKLIVE